MLGSIQCSLNAIAMDVVTCHDSFKQSKFFGTSQSGGRMREYVSNLTLLNAA